MYQLPPDVEAFVAEQMRLGAYRSQDDVLRDAVRALAEKREEIQAIQAGIDDMEAGRMRPFTEVDTEIRDELGFRRRK